MRYLMLALMLSACGLVNDIEDAIDPPPKVVEVGYVVPRGCAIDSAQAADTANFQWCDPGKPPKPAP